MEFGDELDRYVVAKLSLDKYTGTTRTLEAGFQIVGSEVRERIRKDEKRLLKSYFHHWAAPYYGNLKGWREDSPLYIMHGDKLVAGCYLCDQNEFDAGERWGQRHYTFTHPSYGRRGLQNLLFKEVVNKAKSWGLQGFIISTDRYQWADVLIRWGAVPWKEIPKSIEMPKHANLHHFDWLVYRIHDDILWQYLKRYASGILVDIGCGTKPYAVMTKGLVAEHIGVDHTETEHDRGNIDIIASFYDTTLPDASADTVLCTAVLEHLERPLDALREMGRILKPGGHVILSAPLFWHVHEEPRDFYRYTGYGLQYLFTESGFEIMEVQPLSGFVVTFGQELCYFLQRFHRRPIGWLIAAKQFLIQSIAYRLNRWDRSYGFTWMYLVVARKPRISE